MQTGSKPSLMPAMLSTAESIPVPASGHAAAGFLAMTSDVEGVDLTRLARAVDAFPQIGWFDAATGSAWLGLGAADEVIAGTAAEARRAADVCRERLRDVQGHDLMDDVRYFGGLAFDPESPPHPSWAAGLPARFVLPELILRQEKGQSSARVVAIAPLSHEDDPAAVAMQLSERLSRLLASNERSKSLPEGILSARRIEDPEARSRYARIVRQALAEIGPSEKVVLSRDVKLSSAAPLDPWVVLERLGSRSPGHRFCFRFEPEAAFVGATPERLVSVDGDAVRSDCLAGTIARGPSLEEDLRLAARLLDSEKDRREHRFVVDAIKEALAPLCVSLDVAQAPSVLRTPTVQHLHTPVSGQLRDGVGLSDILSRLFPTPAVCGTPRETARQAIRRLEERPRGWYAGAVGWISARSSDFAVGIRSAIVHSKGATVFGGGGIVAGSDPEAEFDETERKAAMLVSLLEGHRS